MLGWACVALVQGHSNKAEGKERDGEACDHAIKGRAAAIEAPHLDPAVNREPCPHGDSEIEKRTERMGVEGKSELSVHEGGKACRETAAWAGAIEQQDTGTGRQSELGVSAVSAGIGMEREGGDGHEQPDAEHDELSGEFTPFRSRFIKSHQEPLLE